jgi:hypothetical protein
MSVERCSSLVRILIPAGIDTSDPQREGLAAGESTVKIDWNDQSQLIVGLPQDPSSVVPPCHFTVLFDSPTKIALHARWLANGVGAEFTFYATRINPQEYPIKKNCDQRRYTSGIHSIPPASVGSNFPPFRKVDGFDWSLGEQNLNLYFSSSSGAMPVQLNALVRGKGFDFRTGPVQTLIRTPGESDAVSDWADLNFTPEQP